MSDEINDMTGTPHTLSLADVFADIKLAPGQVSEFLRGLAYPHLGGAHDEMARMLIQHANRVADPATYGDVTIVNNPQARWGQQAPAQGSPSLVPTSATTPVPVSGAAQGQSALPAFGTTNEPSWMADARAAGWGGPDDTAAPEPSWQSEARKAGWQQSQSDSAPPNLRSDINPPSSANAQPRHWDGDKQQWIDNTTGQPVDAGDVSPSTPPQPSAPRQ